MILEWIQKILERRLNKKKQEVIRLRWQRADLEKKIRKMNK